jgi:hypothetical protein
LTLDPEKKKIESQIRDKHPGSATLDHQHSSVKKKGYLASVTFTCGAVGPLVVIRAPIRHRLILHQAAPAKLITVQADEHPAHPADPVVVEQRRLAHVAHLADAPHGPLPRDRLVPRLAIKKPTQKNPPKKTHPKKNPPKKNKKNHLKKPTKNVFLGFF